MTFQEGLNQVDKASQLIAAGNHMVTDAIMKAFLFTWKWWIAVAMIVVPWLLWAIFRKRESSARLLLAGLIVMMISAILDTYGVENGRWVYPVKVIPSATVSYGFRLSVIPVGIMFLLQFKPNFNPFIKAILFGGFGAYIGMPILATLDLYKNVNWAFTYSFFILAALYLLAHWVSRMNSFEKLEVNNVEYANREIKFNFLRRKEKVR